jgi:MFS family permease
VTELGVDAGAPALEPDLTRPLPRALRALAFRDFRRFWAGALGSSIGNNMQLAALGWVVALSTRSAAKVTLLAFVTVFPLLVLGPLGGALADRFPRRKLLLVTQTALMAQALALWIVWELDLASYWTLFGISLAGGVVIALNTPAWQSIVPQLVPREYLQNAITLNSTQFNISRALGPMFAGLLIASVGAGLAFLLNALSFLIVLAALVSISAEAPDRVGDPAARASVLHGFTESVRYMRDQPGLMVAIGTHAAFALFAAPVVQLIPVLSVEVLDVGPSAFGFLLGSFGIGAIAIALVLGTIDEHVAPSRLLAAGLLLTSVVVVGLGLSTNLAIGILFMIGFGAAYVTVVAIDHNAIQSLSDDHIRGRVTSLWLMTFGLFFPLGTILQGVIADAVGLRAVLVTSGILVALTLAFFWARRLLGKIDVRVT